MEFVTERLVIRPWRADDAARLYSLAGDPEIGYWCGWQPHQSEEDSARLIRTILSNRRTYAICLKSTGEPIGSISIDIDGDSMMTNWEDEGELGFWIGRPYWGNRYAEEAAEALMDDAFNNLNLSKIWSGTFDGNERSLHAQKRLGFVPVRVEHDYFVPAYNRTTDHHVAEMTRENWNRRHS